MISMVHQILETQRINVILYFEVVLSSIHSHTSSTPILSESNYSEWLEHMQFTLGVLDLDLALFVEKPVDLTDKSIMK